MPGTATLFGGRALLRAAEDGFDGTAEHLLKGGFADVNYQDEEGQTALAIATEKGHAELVKILLSYGANVDRGKEPANPVNPENIANQMVAAGNDNPNSTSPITPPSGRLANLSQNPLANAN